jgi:hypothetical protein
MFACPSPKNTNHAGLYLTKAGHLVDRHGRDWGRSSMRRMALDQELDGMSPAPSANEDDGCEEKMKALRVELERLTDVDGLNLGDKARGAIIRLLQKHCPDTWHRDGGAKARDAEPAERDPDGLKHFLRGRGLSEDDLEELDEVLAAINERGEVSDELPVAGAEHAALPRGGGSVIKKHREPGEKTFQPASDSTSFLRKFPEAARIGGTFGSGQYDEALNDRRTARQRRLAADASGDAAGERLARKFPDLARIKVGEWR